jgi:hypothetical protein
MSLIVNLKEWNDFLNYIYITWKIKFICNNSFPHLVVNSTYSLGEYFVCRFLFLGGRGILMFVFFKTQLCYVGQFGL